MHAAATDCRGETAQPSACLPGSAAAAVSFSQLLPIRLEIFALVSGAGVLRVAEILRQFHRLKDSAAYPKLERSKLEPKWRSARCLGFRDVG